jgi:adenylate kinase
MNLLICGYPYSGKGTQGKLVADAHGLMHISTGELLRQETASGTRLGLISKSYTDQGLFTPNEFVMEMMESTIKQNKDAVRGFLLDGFPRFVEQAKSFDVLCEVLGLRIDGVLNLIVPEDELIRRGLLRIKGSLRSDDTPDMIPKRIGEHTKRAVPLEAYYRQQGIVYDIDGVGSEDEVMMRISEALKTIKSQIKIEL